MISMKNTSTFKIKKCDSQSLLRREEKRLGGSAMSSLDKEIDTHELHLPKPDTIRESSETQSMNGHDDVYIPQSQERRLTI